MISPWVSWSFHDLMSSRRWIRMSAAQQAVYMNLLGTQATDGPLPKDLDELAFLACRNTRDIDEDDFPSLWVPPLSSCFEERGDGLVNPRLAMEMDVAAERSSRGREAARARWSKSSGKAKAKPKQKMEVMPEHMPEHCESECHTDIQTDTLPQPPQEGAFDESLFGEGSPHAIASALCPNGRASRQGSPQAATWANEWKSTGCSTALLKRAIGRHRRSADKPDLLPSAEELSRHAEAAIREGFGGILPLERAAQHAQAEPDGAHAKALTSAGLEWQSPEFQRFGRNEEAWKRSQVIAAIEREEGAA